MGGFREYSIGFEGLVVVGWVVFGDILVRSEWRLWRK